ncbi:hypothetical protein [Paraglaciecola arctica]|uniref:Signal peptide prediction n=1 Tax=Paraglaciecola arctica BSs20135 TaxID=493475 RepID=K6XJN0_9ALTE|nr:hypothetical protein [Paraglaciecola arctica]GAC20849.1 signal peptide prediction [Paraglaciecola arctica BSs20135]
MQLNWLKKIGNKAVHNAFVDLCEFNQQLFCCYREAKNHISAEAGICILTLNKEGKVCNINRLKMANVDLRDPKLSITPDGRLLLIAYARKTNHNNGTLSVRNLCWVSQTGHSWSSHREFAAKGGWLWRVRWQQDIAYGFAYSKKNNTIHLYSGDPRRSFHCHQPNALSLQKHNKGYPNESDLLFEDDNAYAIVRRDADSYSAQLGTSGYPYKKWQWLDLGLYIGGPVMLKIAPKVAIVAGRIIKKGKLVTGLMQLNLSNGKLFELGILPSAGDNSYPGLVLDGQILYVSYYSSHQDNKSSVYLAQLDLSLLINKDELA